jgi:ribonuclease HI
MREIYCDGAAEPTNPGPIGWGVFIPDELRLSIPGGYGTNQQAELRAVNEALKLAKPGDVIFTDSQYAIGMITKRWKAKANVKLVAEGRRLYESKPGVEIRWIRGHNGHPHQERSDLLANVAAQTQMVRRFHDDAEWANDKPNQPGNRR